MAVPAVAQAPPDSTWTPLGILPESLDSPVFALAVSPQDGQQVLAGTQSGSIYRSVDGGADWQLVRHADGHPVTTLAFNPYRPGQIFAGIRRSGIWVSSDNGQTWSAQAGAGPVTPRSFGFAKSLVAAGTDKGIFVNRDGTSWTPSGPNPLNVAAVAVAAVNEPVRLIVGAQAPEAGSQLSLLQSSDGALTWNSIQAAAASGAFVNSLLAGPLPQGREVRPMLMGTSRGAYLSGDNGATWTQLSGGGTLPATDVNQVAFNQGHPERFYVSSDGATTDRGGLWGTSDSGAHFQALKLPVPTVSAMAVSAEESPTLYVATFRAADHAAMLWAYRDTGGPPRAPLVSVPSPVIPVRAPDQPVGAPASWRSLVTGPEGPFLLLGLGGLAVLVFAGVAYLRRGGA
jgi:photosystem II stability/assembly factor-like uncharacterized protein